MAPMKAETAISCLVLLLGLAGLACSPAAEPPAQESEIVRQGRQIFQSDACPTCHGRDRTGTNNGPSLQGLRSRWNEEDLIRFLRDPSVFKHADPRLKQLAARFKTTMPSPAKTDEARLRTLADYLLQD